MPKKKVIVLPNKDKDRFKKEKWKKGRDIGCIPHPFRLLALGSVGRGKTTVLKNIFLCHQASKAPFKELYIVCPDTSTEWEDSEPTDILHRFPDPDQFNPKKKTLLVIDDFELTGLNTAQKRQLSTLFRYVSSHCNVSIMMSFQSFFDCPPIARKTANCFCLWKPTSIMECNQMGNRCGLDKGILNALFDQYAPGDFDSLMIDRTVGTPCPIRKNIYEVIKDLPDPKKPVKKKQTKKPIKKPKRRSKKVVYTSSDDSLTSSDSD